MPQRNNPLLNLNFEEQKQEPIFETEVDKKRINPLESLVFEKPEIEIETEIEVEPEIRTNPLIDLEFKDKPQTEMQSIKEPEMIVEPPINLDNITETYKFENPREINMFQKIKDFFITDWSKKEFSPQKQAIKDQVALTISEEFNIRPSESTILVEPYLENTFQQSTKKNPLEQVVNTALQLTTMPAQFIAGKATALGTIATLKAFSELTPERIRQEAEKNEFAVADFISTPETPLAKNVSKVLGDVFDIAFSPVHWVDRQLFKNYPNAGYVVGLMGELAILSVGGKAIKKIDRATSTLTKNLMEGKTTNNKVVTDSYKNLIEKDSSKEGFQEGLKIFNDIVKKAEKEVKSQSQTPLESLRFYEEFPNFNPFSLKEGDIQVNVSKRAKKKIKIGSSLMNELQELPPQKTPWVVGSFTTPWNFFNKHKSLKPLYLMSKESKSKIFDRKKDINDFAKRLLKEFPNKKYRKNLYADWVKKSESGLKVAKIADIKGGKFPNEYRNLEKAIGLTFEDFFSELNKMRDKIGLPKIKKIENYIPLMAKEKFFDFLRTEETGADLIYNQMNTASSPYFAFLKRGELKEGLKLEQDPIALLLRYSDSAIPHLYNAPLNSFIKEITTKDLYNKSTNESFSFRNVNPQIAEELASWSNFIAGKENFPLSRPWRKSIQKLNNNLTASTLFGSLRTVMIQPTALTTISAVNPIKSTLKGIESFFTQSKDIPVNKSIELKSRIADPSLVREQKKLVGSTYERVSATTREAASFPLRKLDSWTAEIAFRIAYESLKPLIKSKKITEKEAIRRADESVIQTQGSGALEDLSPAQRNALGKMMTLWQTFAINHTNLVAKEVLGIKNPELKPKESSTRAMKYMFGVMSVNFLFEDVIGMPSPYPAPIKTFIASLKQGDPNSTIMLKTIMELGELLPGFSSLKFGSHPLGPAVDLLGILSSIMQQSDFNKNIIERALAGDKRALILLGDVIGKFTGITGTAQATKYLRGKVSGKDDISALIGRKVEPKRKSLFPKK